MFTIRDVLTTLELQQENDITTFNTANILVSMEDCPLVAILGILIVFFLLKIHVHVFRLFLEKGYFCCHFYGKEKLVY